MVLALCFVAIAFAAFLPVYMLGRRMESGHRLAMARLDYLLATRRAVNPRPDGTP